MLVFFKNQQVAEDNNCNSSFALTRTSRVGVGRVENIDC